MAAIPEHIDIARIPTGTEATLGMQLAHERLFAEFAPDNPPVIRNLQAFLDNDNAALIVAISGNTPESPGGWQNLPSERYLGTLILFFTQTLTQDLAILPHVAVSGEHQSQGIGTALVRKALEECGLRGVSRLELTSGPSKPKAHAMYRRLGFYTHDTINWRYTFDEPI